jgi:Domain of unknown function (DUF1929)
VRITHASTKTALCLSALIASGTARAQVPSDTAATASNQVVNETDDQAPINYGVGPGIKRAMPKVKPAAVPTGNTSAATQGLFGAPVTWPIIAIHMLLMPDGRVINYGTDTQAHQGAELIYDVWTPSLGTGSNAHLLLPNTTTTDIFCSAQAMMWTSGNVLITGGDLTISGTRNFSNNNVELFTPGSNALTQLSAMQYPRWYPTIVPMPNGEMLVLGGRTAPNMAATVPEVFNPTTGWRTLTGAASTLAFGNAGLHWYYPRGMLDGGGNVFLITPEGKMWTVTTAGAGTVTRLLGLAAVANHELPTLMYAPNQILSVRSGPAPQMINIAGKKPVVTNVPGISQTRYWASGTVMADGRVVITGGSLVANQLQGVALAAEIWDPATGAWSFGASATIPRLYHSNGLLLPDGSVITAGGGAPGPVKNLNAEIYFPSYLYDSSGQPAVRPTFTIAQSVVSVGGTITGTVGAADTISRITFVRTGSATHSTNLDQRLVSLPFTQTGQAISATLPSGALTLPPGYYMIFAFNSAGVPAIASIVLLHG